MGYCLSGNNGRIDSIRDAPSYLNFILNIFENKCKGNINKFSFCCINICLKNHAGKIVQTSFDDVTHVRSKGWANLNCLVLHNV